MKYYFYCTRKNLFWYFQPSKPVNYYCLGATTNLFSRVSSILQPSFLDLSSAPASTTSFKATSFPKLPNPCSPPPSQTQKLVGFNPSLSFPTQNFRFSTTHQQYSSTRRSSKNITTTAFFFNKPKSHCDSSRPRKHLNNLATYFEIDIFLSHQIYKFTHTVNPLIKSQFYLKSQINF